MASFIRGNILRLMSGRRGFFFRLQHYVIGIAGFPVTGRLLSSRLSAESHMITTDPIYRAVQEPDYSWSVIVVETGLPYRVSGYPMDLLTEDVATALAEVLNDIDNDKRTIH